MLVLYDCLPNYVALLEIVLYFLHDTIKFPSSVISNQDGVSPSSISDCRRPFYCSFRSNYNTVNPKEYRTDPVKSTQGVKGVPDKV